MARDWRFWVPVTCAALCVLWCVFVGVVFWLEPPVGVGEVTTASVSSDGSTSSSTKIVREPVPVNVWALLAPVLVAGLALLAATARAWGLVAIVGVAFALLAFLGSFSIGAVFVPAAALAFISAALGAMLD